MKIFIVLSALAAVALAKPGLLLQPAHITKVYAAPQAYVKMVPGAPIGHDGRVVDTPEVAHAKIEHEAAHVNEKITLAKEAVKSADIVTYAAAAPALIATSYQVAAPIAHQVAAPIAHHVVAPIAYTKLVPAAPLGHDGRVVDTPEVAHAKAEHLAAHAHEKINLAHEESKHVSSHYVVPVVQHVAAYSSGSWPSQHAAAPISLW